MQETLMASAAIKEEIRDWWAAAPMTYGEVHGDADYVRPDGTVEQVDIGTRRFFELADERFYSWNKPLHEGGVPFSGIFDYPRYAGKKVIEVGCGMGCMAMNWAARGARMTAVDLNPVAVQQTEKRFKAFGLEGTFMEADGEHLPFDDNSFDYAYSWGVPASQPGTETIDCGALPSRKTRLIDRGHALPSQLASLSLHHCLHRRLHQHGAPLSRRGGTR